MSTPQLVYLILVAVYLGFFALFLRLFVWKYYSYRFFWGRRPPLSMEAIRRMAAERGQPLPRFSLLVPARNEADVIHRTIDHLSRLDYPKNCFEIVVATDQKEALQSERDRSRTVAELVTYLRQPGERDLSPAAQTTLLQLCARFALEESGYARRQLGYAWPEETSTVPIAGQRQVVRETAEELLRGRGRAMGDKLQAMLHRVAPNLTAEEARRLYPVFLSLAMPVLLALAHLSGRRDDRMVARMLRFTARANQVVTQKIIRTMAEGMAHRIGERLARLARSASLGRVLEEAYRQALPTTQDVVEAKIQEWAAIEHAGAALPVLKHVEVPCDFDGRVGGACLGHEVPSTKGRALNYALGFVAPETEMIGFYDAESRPDPRVLMHVAYRRLQDGSAVGILQGPVFQVRNFFDMGPVSKVASLFTSISHDWYLPILMKRVPFVGGTNVFVDSALLQRIGGWDHTTLTEDFEMGTRAYLEAGVWPEYLPYPSTEQTPPTLRGFFFQRLRWGAGYLQVVDKIWRAIGYPNEKRLPLLRTLLLKGHVEWTVYQAAALLPIVSLILWSQELLDPSIIPEPAYAALIMTNFIYLGFTFYAFWRYASHVDGIGYYPLWRQVGAVGQLLLAPVSCFFLPVPYSSALVLRAMRRGPKAWVKTPRSRE